MKRTGFVLFLGWIALGCGGEEGAAPDSSVAADARISDGAPVDGAVTTSAVRINEIDGQGPDWFELYNSGSTTVALGGFQVADLDETTMGPKLTEAASFPAGTMLPAGGYLVVLANQAAPGSGPQTMCETVVASCFHAGFGISPSRGDKIHLLDASGAVVASTAYPMGVPAGQSYGHLPAGGLGNLTRTPGAANTAAP